MNDLFLVTPNKNYQKSFENYAPTYSKINDEHYFNKYKRALENFRDYLNDLQQNSKLDWQHSTIEAAILMTARV